MEGYRVDCTKGGKGARMVLDNISGISKGGIVHSKTRSRVVSSPIELTIPHHEVFNISALVSVRGRCRRAEP